MSSETKDTPALVESVPVVALGASAGGLDALKAFFGGVPPATGAAYVVITHRGADDVTLLPEILGKYTTMPVVEATDNLRLKPGHVYTSPATHYLRLFDGAVMFADIVRSAVPLPVDFFFRSLAEQRREKGVCVILSGNGSDGTLGLQAVKAEGGYALVQDVRSAKFGDMPASAVGTGLADEVLRPEEMAGAIRDYLASLEAKQARPATVLQQDEALNEILVLVRRRTGSDFGLYKSNTLGRRIERRMNVHHLSDAWDYVRYLQHNEQEIALLFKEFLIGVTAFFRDDAFAVLEKEALPELLKNKQDGGTVRIWVSGCSTGEEAYSLAMLVQEYMEKNSRKFSVQIFATDLDENAINTGRAAIYSDGIGLDVSEARLERHFVREDSHYRIRKHLREMVIFATQNLVQDPPFTKLDLVSCRNLLIYLDSATQKRLMPVFHYALRPGGMLFLGSSETVGTFNNIFDAVNARARIFQRKEVAMPVNRISRLSDYSRLAAQEPRASEPDSRPPDRAPSINELAQRLLLKQHVPPSVIVNEKGDVFFIHGRTGQYLEPPQGQGQRNLNVFDMAREGLELPLIAVLRRAFTQDGEVYHKGVIIQGESGKAVLNLRARKVDEPEALRGLIWVTFEREDDETLLEKAETITTTPTGELELELRFVKESLQNTIEELETANEQLKSVNEELQSTNEELQSGNEELETAKEEMQSMNEELQTVNAELESKVGDLGSANDDMKNLLNNTGIATLYLDNDLNIKRFTHQTKKIINLIPTDIGRPIGDIATQLAYQNLVEDAAQVLQSLVFKEIEVRLQDWSWYLMRIMPYRTTENVIDGLTVTFVDITRLKRSEILLDANAKALSMMAIRRAPLTETLDEILLTIEGQTPGIWCSVSNIDGDLLRHCSAPTLPKPFNDVLDGIKITPDSAAPCVRALIERRHVVDQDIASKTPPDEFTVLALRYNIRAAWAQPILSEDRKVVGVFTIYYHQAHRPSDMEEALVNQAVPLMAVALTRAHAEAA